MNENQKYKEMLENEKVELVQKLKKVGRINPDNPQDWEPVPGENDEIRSDPDANVAADAVEAFESQSSVEVVLENRFNEVLDALKRIEEGKYGICHIGGEEIEEDRLRANPAAQTCKKHIDE